jgi:hypothetical protein
VNSASVSTCREFGRGLWTCSKVEAPIWLEISDCAYSETRFGLTKNTRRK